MIRQCLIAAKGIIIAQAWKGAPFAELLPWDPRIVIVETNDFFEWKDGIIYRAFIECFKWLDPNIVDGSRRAQKITRERKRHFFS